MKIGVRTDGMSVYLSDENGNELRSISGAIFCCSEFESPLEWMKAIIADLDAPDSAKDEAAAHAKELLDSWNRLSNMLSCEAVEARLEQLEADMNIGGGYGDDEADAHAQNEIARLKQELFD